MNYKLLIRHPLKITFIAFWALSLISCGGKSSLSENTALSAVENYLKTNPIFETTVFTIGEVKLRNSKDKAQINSYNQLATQGYIQMDLEKEKKKFLSKDSIYTYNIKLTDKARPYVHRQKKNKVEVKSFEFQLDEKEKAKIELTGKNSGTVVVSLKKIQTDFAVFAKDAHPNTTFITKAFKLKYKKDEGWVVAK